MVLIFMYQYDEQVSDLRCTNDVQVVQNDVTKEIQIRMKNN
jgi:hypothetical protein